MPKAYLGLAYLKWQHLIKIQCICPHTTPSSLYPYPCCLYFSLPGSSSLESFHRAEHKSSKVPWARSSSAAYSSPLYMKSAGHADNYWVSWIKFPVWPVLPDAALALTGGLHQSPSPSARLLFASSAICFPALCLPLEVNNSWSILTLWSHGIVYTAE